MRRGEGGDLSQRTYLIWGRHLKESCPSADDLSNDDGSCGFPSHIHALAILLLVDASPSTASNQASHSPSHSSQTGQPASSLLRNPLKNV